MRERGSALLIAVVSVTVLLLISGVFFSLVNDQMKSNSYEEKAIKSYYLAQAGVFYGIAKINATTVPPADGAGKSTEAPPPDPFGYGGQFTVEWQISQDAQYYTITGNGSYGSGTGEVIRSLQAYYKIGVAGGTPGEIVSQELLIPGDDGQGNTRFIFSNTNPLNNSIPVNTDQPIYIYSVKVNNINNVIGYATSVRLSLRKINSDQTISDETVPIIDTNLMPDETQSPQYKYIVPNFHEVSDLISISYNGNESVCLVVEGYIATNANPPDPGYGTGTFTNPLVSSPYAGIIWQVEQ